jgi:hypothetical protein
MSGTLIATQKYMLTAGISGGSAPASMPATNLKKRNPDDKFRLQDLSNAYIIVDLAEPKEVNIIAILYANTTLDAKYRIRAGNTNAVSSYDSGDITFSNFSGLSHRDGLTHTYKYFEQPLTYRFWRIDLYDQSNPDTFLDIGSLIIDKGFKPEFGYALGESFKIADPSKKTKSLSGAISVVKRKPYIDGYISFECQSKESMYDGFFEIDQSCLSSNPMLLIKNVNEPEKYKQLFTIYCIIKEATPIINDHYQLYSKRYEYEELV